MKKLITVKIQNLVAVLAIAWLALAQVASAQQVIDVYDTTDPDNWIMIGNIQTILSPQSGGAHYNFYSASSHALCVDLGYRKSNIWVHENSNATDDLTFGFVFHNEDDSRTLSPNNTALLDFRIVDSTSNPSTVVSDDPGEAVETPAGSDAFKGKFTYNNQNTDGIAVSGVSGRKRTLPAS